MNRALLIAALAETILANDGGLRGEAWERAETLLGDRDVDAMSPSDVQELWVNAHKVFV